MSNRCSQEDGTGGSKEGVTGGSQEGGSGGSQEGGSGVSHEGGTARTEDWSGRWKIVDGSSMDGWISWESLGRTVKDPRHLLEWKRCSPMSIGWSGLVRFKPGQELPLHTHDPPEIYYIIKGRPLIELGGERVRVGPLSCVTIPSQCPHKVINDTDQEVLIMYVYMPVDGNSVTPEKNHNWTFLEEV